MHAELTKYQFSLQVRENNHEEFIYFFCNIGKQVKGSHANSRWTELMIEKNDADDARIQ